ncbi:MAG: threonine/serine dehydratase [Pseudohongiellaceae bacterium]
MKTARAETAVTPDDIERAHRRLTDLVVRTPLLASHALDALTGGHIHIKAENLQRVGAFKIRGACNRLSQLSAAEKQRGVVAFSSGNHSQGVACAAQILDMQATLVMPSDAPQVKIDGTRGYGADIRFYDRETEDREQLCRELAERSGAVVVPAYDDPDVIAGQGTCGFEIQGQLAGRVPDMLLCPCGGGGLLAGTATALRAAFPEMEVWGVEPEGFEDHRLSLATGQRVALRGERHSFCDALLARMPGELTWAINSRLASGFLAVSDDDVAYAISYAWRYLKLVLEPGGAVALAALLRRKIDVTGQRVCIVLSGGNIDGTLFTQCLQRYA